MKQKIAGMAKEMGFARVGFVSAAPFLQWGKDSLQGKSGLIIDPSAILADVTCIMVLLWPSPPYTGFREGSVPFPSYYTASNNAYFAANALAKKLSAFGQAQYTQRIPQRHAALRMGGIVGKNQLLYIEGLGSYFAIQTVLLDFLVPDEEQGISFCKGCGKCIQSCPTNALRNGFTREDCMRDMLERKEISSEALPHLSGVLGCEICQRACPLNAGIIPVAPSEEVLRAFEVGRLLEPSEQDKKDQQQLVGKNYAKRLPWQTGQLRKKQEMLASPPEEL
ncbi:4Fe-4S binding protein [Clostridia bacterium OttesenSCG-928-F22]|nr:4Fe-4S binding protein [Clostridia bacterium OttesenSCG-928-F22]